jgi:hypothetical protein
MAVISELALLEQPILRFVIAHLARRRAVDSAVDACILSLGCTMLFPASLIPEREIIPGVRQHTRTSLSPKFDSDTVKFENFFGRPY